MFVLGLVSICPTIVRVFVVLVLILCLGFSFCLVILFFLGGGTTFSFGSVSCLVFLVFVLV